MTLGYIDTELRHQGIRRSKLRDCERRNRELTDAQDADTELGDTDNAARELSDSDDATCHDWSSVGPVLERDVDERQARNRDFRLVLVAPAVPYISSWIRSTALRTSECLLRDSVCAFATRLHQWPSCRTCHVSDRYINVCGSPAAVVQPVLLSVNIGIAIVYWTTISVLFGR
jgi:hypothetical protein